jgi:hypothetical protein
VHALANRAERLMPPERRNRPNLVTKIGASPDLNAALGHGAERGLWIIPSLELIVAWMMARSPILVAAFFRASAFMTTSHAF